MKGNRAVHNQISPRSARDIFRNREVVLSFGISAVFVLIAFTLLVLPPVHGVADNGDYSRLMRWIGLEHTSSNYDEIFFDWFRRYYAAAGHVGIGMPSSSALFILAAYVLNNLINDRPVFDIVALGFVYTLCMGLAIYLVSYTTLSVSRHRVVTVAALLLLIYIVIDPAYLLFFNSFFSEPATFIFLTAAVGALLLYQQAMTVSGKNISRTPLIVLITVLVLLGTTKQQNVLVGLLAVFALVFSKGQRISRSHFAALAIIAAALPLAWGAAAKMGADKYDKNITAVNRFNTVFYGIGMVSSKPDAVLDALGFKPQDRERVGQSVFVPENKTFITDPAGMKTVKQVSLIKVLYFYLTDVQAITRAGQLTLEAMKSSRISYLGNFEESAGPFQRKKTLTYSWSWSTLRDRILSVFPEAVLIYPVTILLVLIVLGLRGYNMPLGPPLLFLCAYALTQMLIVIVGDGFYEHQKHLIYARFALDISLPLSLIYFTTLPFKQLNGSGG